MSKRLVILGGGESGVGTALLGKQKGYEVFLSDKGVLTDKYKEVLKKEAIDFEENQHTEKKILNADLVVKSPGIPDSASLIVSLKAENIPVISEIEFASWFTDATLVGITGSNGKTTVTSWTDYTLKNGGLETIMAGNIGESFAKSVAAKNPDYYVLELSSFQLDGIEKFHPHISVITNITPDHLDRYNYDFDAYIASKFRITKNQTSADYFIYDADDKAISGWLEKNEVKAQQLPLKFDKHDRNGAYLENNHLHIIINDNHFTMPQDTLALKGQHNTKNAMAAATVAQLLKIRKQTIRESLERFHGVEHRLEFVLKINNVQYINDSKATNVNATYYALESMKSDTVWIVGGVDKGNDYSELLPFVNEKVKAIICLGLDNQKIIDAFSNCVDLIIETNSMEEAVHQAYHIAEKGNNVLLSPACASFDLFKNYEERGRQFKEQVRRL